MFSVDSGRVIAAFPATGKTYVAGRDHRFADSDSSSFSWESPGVRHPDWPANYIEHIEGVIADGSTALCSTHQEVRDALVEAGIEFTVVYPHEGLRDEYLTRLRDRGSPPGLIDLVEHQWPALVRSCRTQAGCKRVELRAGQYLIDVLSRSTP